VQEVISTFINIQTLERKMLEAQKVLDEAPEKLESLEGRLSRAKKDFQDLKTSIDNNLTLQKTLEQDLIKLGEMKIGHKARLTKVDDEKTYKAVLKEGETIAKRTKEKEDESLTLMELQDTLTAKLPPLEEALIITQKDYDKEMAEILAAKEKASDFIRKSNEEKDALLSSIEPKLAEQYLYASSMRPGQVMAPIADSTCLICRISIPPQLFIELQRNDKIMLCPNCHRIMYWRDHPAWAPPEEPKDESTLGEDSLMSQKKEIKNKTQDLGEEDWQLQDVGSSKK
jgi:predicted  nucleic acid-binding Zn-ribbon protein